MSLETASYCFVRWPMIRAYGFSLLGILVLAFFPVASVAIAATIANLGGCHLDEAAVHPCLIAGMDLGRPLAYMNILGWWMIVTLPVGALLLVCWLLALLIQLVVFYRKRRAGS